MLAPLIAAALSLQAPPPAGDLAAIDAAFTCPETLPSEAARVQALGDFMDAVSAARPTEGIVQALAYRRLLLAKHGCTQSLAGLKATEDAVAAGRVLDQAWLPLGSGDGMTLSVSTSVVKSYLDPRVPGARAVETYAKVDWATPQTTDATHTRYDGIVSHAVYYCGSRRYALAENDYFLGGALQRRDPSPVAAKDGDRPLYAITEAPPGSLNDKVSHWACGAENGAPA